MNTLSPFSPPKLETPDISADVRLNGQEIELEFKITRTQKIKNLPPMFVEKTKAGERADHLWESTCFEAFWTFSQKKSDPYWEFNLSPDGKWNLYAFSSYRHRNLNFKVDTIPEIESHTNGDTTTIIARIPFGNGKSNLKLYFGLSAVLEHLDGEKTYWALKHESKDPDFHDKRAFTLIR